MQVTQYGIPARPLHTEIPEMRANRTRPKTETLEYRAMVNPRMSKRRQQILDFILSFREKHGTCPTIREIGEAVGLLSSSTVATHLYTLCQLGKLRRHPSKPRSYVPTEGCDRLERLELQVIEMEQQLASRFQAGYEAGCRETLERLSESSSTSTQGYPQAACDRG